MTLTVGSLFSGIGGLDLGLERAGMRVVWQSEIDPYACRVLAKHWPDVPNLGDITTIDWSTVEPVDVICGGYPCQPFSIAGVRRGESDPRHLWPHFANAIRLLRPRYALLENVPGHLSLGFGRVLGDLAELGFDAEWECIPAAFVGAPHLRYRLFVVAHADRESESGLTVNAEPRSGVVVVGRPEQRRDVADTSGGWGSDRELRPRRDESWVCGAELADANRPARRGEGRTSEAISRHATIERPGRCGGGEWQYWSVEPDVGRVAHGIPSRLDRLKCLGNAVVPQVAEYVGRRIMEAAA